MSDRSLLLIPSMPYPLVQAGGSQRSELLRTALGRFGDVDVACFGLPDEVLGTPQDPRAQSALRVVAAFGQSEASSYRTKGSRWLPGPVRRLRNSLVEQQALYAVRPAIAQAVRDLVRTNGYRVVVARYLRAAAWSDLASLDGVIKVLDIDDVDWMAQRSWMSEHPWPGWRGRVSARLLNHGLERLARRAYGRMDHLWVANLQDAKRVKPLHASVLPNIPFGDPPAAQRLSPSSHASETLLFVGLLGWPANASGLDRFISRVWTRIRQARPSARLRVVGGGLTSEARRTAWAREPGVELAGFVEDLAAEYAKAAFAIVPVYYGGGTKIKVLEALSFLRTCVVTPHVEDGYLGTLADGREYLVGRSDEGFADACVRLLRDIDVRRSLAAAGRTAVETTFSRQAFNHAVAGGLASVGVRGPVA